MSIGPLMLAGMPSAGKWVMNHTHHMANAVPNPTTPMGAQMRAGWERWEVGEEETLEGASTSPI
jgi:hypothetical protein